MYGTSRSSSFSVSYSYDNEGNSSKLNGINISKSYTGYVYDETTGYWNAGARMYNSTDRTFIQKDPEA